MHDPALLMNYLVLGGVLFALGLAGFLVRRNMIVAFLCAEMMLQGVAVSLVAWGRYHGDWGGQVFTLFILTVAACEAALALALVLMLFLKAHTLDLFAWQDLREEGLPAVIDQEVPEETAADQVWPTLTPAGRDPKLDPETELFRPRV